MLNYAKSRESVLKAELRIKLKAENPDESDSFVTNAQACPQQSHAHPHRAMPGGPRSHRPSLAQALARTGPRTPAHAHSHPRLPKPAHARPRPPTPACVGPRTHAHARAQES